MFNLYKKEVEQNWTKAVISKAMSNIIYKIFIMFIDLIAIHNFFKSIWQSIIK